AWIQLPHRLEWTAGECQRDCAHARQYRTDQGEGAQRADAERPFHPRNTRRISRSAEHRRSATKLHRLRRLRLLYPLLRRTVIIPPAAILGAACGETARRTSESTQG